MSLCYLKKSSLTTKNVSKKSSHNTKDVNDIEAKLNLILEKIIIYYLNNTSYGQKIQKKLDLYMESLKHKILSGVPPEKLIPFLETIDANIQKIAEILQNVDKGIDIISNKKKAFEAAAKKARALGLHGTLHICSSKNEKIEEQLSGYKTLLMNPEIVGWVLDQWQSDPGMMLEPATEMEKELNNQFIFSRFVAELDDIEDLEAMEPKQQRAYLKALYRFLAA